MAEFWTRPEKVEAQQWHPQMGVLGRAHPVGCWVCGTGYPVYGYYSACVNPAGHDPVRHPHHLVVATPTGDAALFDGYWLVTFPDGAQRVYSPAEFAIRFTDEDVQATLARMEQTLQEFEMALERAGARLEQARETLEAV